MKLDARTAGRDVTLSADLCVIGGGPAGLVLAREADAAGRRVVVVDSGGFENDDSIQDLNAGETTGDPYQELSLCRFRRVGGTAAIWNTWFKDRRSAKYVPLDPIDFEARDWIPWSGWPFPRIELEPYYLRAAALCSGAALDFAVAPWNTGALPRLEFAPGGLTNCLYQYGPAERFTDALPAQLAASGRTTLTHGATVTELVRDGAGSGARVNRARWRTLSGESGEVRAENFVLATGGIENARMLLLAFGERPWLGRGFMEHPVDSSLVIHSRHPALPAGGFYAPRATEAGPPVHGRIGLSAELQRAERLGNSSLRLVYDDDEPELLQSPRLLPAARRLVPFQPLRRLIGDTVRAIARARRPVSATQWRLLIDLEQAPHPENRVTLAEERDRLGLRRATLHWRFREADHANHLRTRAVVVRELSRAGVERIEVDPAQPIDSKHHHHAGTTRLHPDPELGVVDEHLRVHGMENLYVAGSSVFPTAGFANPTLTVVALSLRLADHLSAKR